MWEVLIGAVSALAGGFGGAWLQARSGKQLMKVQLNDAEKTRREAYAREDQARFVDKKREAYANLWSSWAKHDVAKTRVADAKKWLDEWGTPDEGDRWRMEVYQDLYADHRGARQEVEILEEVVFDAYETVALLGPPEIIEALPLLEDDDLENKRRRFLEAAREDLGVPNQPGIIARRPTPN